ncbi:MAG: hypothetical protein ACKOC5_09605 [Chloroflexota bacterium]
MSRTAKLVNGYRPAQALLAYIIDYKVENDGNSPTIRQMAEYMGGSSTSYIARLLQKLEDGQSIQIGKNQARSISVVGGSWSMS